MTQERGAAPSALVLLAGIGALLSVAALASQLLLEDQPGPAPGSERPEVGAPPAGPAGRLLGPSQSGSQAGALEAGGESPDAGQAPKARPIGSPAAGQGSERGPSFLGSARGQAALDLLGPDGPPVKTWVRGRVLDPEGQALAGAQVALRDGADKLLAEDVSGADGSFSLELMWSPANHPQFELPRRLVASRAWRGGSARAATWVRLGRAGAIELQTHGGFDLELRFPGALRNEVFVGRKQGVTKLPYQLPAPVRKLEGLDPGPLWIAVLGVDGANEWQAGLAEGRLGPGAPGVWDVPLHPLARLKVRVSLQGGAPSPAKLVLEPGPENRYRGSSLLTWSSQVLDFEEEDDEEIALPSFGFRAPEGSAELRLPPGAWTLSAYGPPGTLPARAQIEVGVGRAAGQDLSLSLGAAASCEFQVPPALEGGEVVIHGPQGAYVEDLGEGRWRVGGLGPQDRVDVFVMTFEDEAEDEAGEGPLSESSAQTLCGRLRLGPGDSKPLVLARSAALRLRLPPAGEEEDAKAYEFSVRDAGTADSPFSLSWEVGEFEEEAEGNEQVWLRDRSNAMSFSSFERALGSPARSTGARTGEVLLEGLFAGSLELEIKDPQGLTTTRRLTLAPGETRSVDLSR